MLPIRLRNYLQSIRAEPRDNTMAMMFIYVATIMVLKLTTCEYTRLIRVPLVDTTISMSRNSVSPFPLPLRVTGLLQGKSPETASLWLL